MDVKTNLDVFSDYLPAPVTAALKGSPAMLHDVSEVVFRAEKPVTVRVFNTVRYIDENLTFSEKIPPNPLMTSARELKSIFEKVCSYSVYSKQDEINAGFVTVRGGCRVGLCGTAVVKNGFVSNIRDISTLSFRIAREVKGCCGDLLERVNPLDGVLICGAPSSGKTTLIRDLSRVLSCQFKVSLLDERNELSASLHGIPQNDVGLSDVYVSYPKDTALLHAVRSMSPDIIICDEIGDKKDVRAVLSALNCGAAVIASVHCGSLSELKRRKNIMRLLESNAFENIVFLDGRKNVGKIKSICSLSDLYA